jgi:DNA-binding GntR family transcriptional regulator
VRAHRTKTELAVEGLREAVAGGDLRPGERVTLAQLSALLGMSATPIREAIRLLEAEGLVVNEPHRGVTINAVTAEDAAELCLLRAATESLATRLAVPRLTADDLRDLEELHRRLAEAVARGDDDALTEANAEWHLRIYRAARTRVILPFVERLWMPLHASGLWVAEQRTQSVDEHAAVMEALRARDADAAARLMHDHIVSVHDSLAEQSAPPDAVHLGLAR